MTPSLDRLPPYSEEAERGLLGCLLTQPEAALAACDDFRLTTQAFYTHPHQVLWARVQTLLATGRHGIDMVVVSDALRSAGEMDAVGGPSYLEKLVDAATPGYAMHYAEIVAEKARLRAIIEMCLETADEAYQQADRSDNLLAGHSAALSIIEGATQRKEQKWPDTVAGVVAQLEASLAGTAELGVRTGFLNLDNCLYGLKPGHLIILAARPSNGKTSLAMNIVEHVAMQGKACGVFSLEMSKGELAKRMLGSRAKVNMESVDAGTCSQATFARVAAAAAELRQASIRADDQGGLDVSQLRLRAKRWHEKQPLALLVVDYMQLLHDAAHARHSRQIEVAAISAALKVLAKDLDIPVLALSQLSRAGEQGERPRPPRLADLRDSGAIEQDADEVLLLRRPCMYPGDDEQEDKTLAIVHVAKQRSGRTGECRLNFDAEYTRFSDRSRHADAEQPQPREEW